MRYYNNLKMKDLFQNPALANIFPQFKSTDRLQNVYSFDWIDKKVKEYLKNALNASISGDNVQVKGQKETVLKQVQMLKWTIEGFFNNMPSIVKNLRKNTSLYLPFSSTAQIANLKTNEQKLLALNLVLDNINYNPDFKSLNTVDIYKTKMSYTQRQAKWAERVGYYNRRFYD